MINSPKISNGVKGTKMTQQKQINIKGMHCKSCADSIREKLNGLKGVEGAEVSFVQERAFVRFNPEQIGLNAISGRIEEMGYKPSIEDKINVNPQKEKIIRIRIQKPGFLAILISITLILTLILVVGLLASGCSNPSGSGDVNTDDFMNIPLSDITNKAKWYEYNSGANKIRFFAVKASDGSVKTGFDACDVCYTYKKGYRQEGNNMVCNNCGNRYPISGLGTENKTPGGCWPGYLPNTAKEDNIIIKKSDLENNSWRSL